MDLAERLRQFREFKKLSQGDVEKRSGLVRCYISRVENGHTVPTLETLEKFARALKVPLYQFFYEERPTEHLEDPASRPKGVSDWASRGRGKRLFLRLRQAVARMDNKHRALLLHVAGMMAKRKRRGAQSS